MAVEDITLFNTVRAQHGFIEQVLTHLQSGAITIDAAGRVTRFNRRAKQILESAARRRPRPGPPRPALAARRPPLRDDARRPRAPAAVEVELPRRQATSLEVSTSRILDAAGAPCGAVMILDDPTPRHQLHRERQTSQTLDLLNRVLLRLTDEIKNPLVSIYTFLELLPQRYEDPEFRETFLSVVGKDTQRLISLVDKLITPRRRPRLQGRLLRPPAAPPRRPRGASVRLERSAGSARRGALPAPGPGARRAADRRSSTRRQERLVVKADRDQLTKAIGYLVSLPRQPRRARRARGHPPAAVPDDPAACAWRSLAGRPASLSAARARAPVQPARHRLGQAARRGAGREPEDRRGPRRHPDARRPGGRDPLRPDPAANAISERTQRGPA